MRFLSFTPRRFPLPIEKKYSIVNSKHILKFQFIRKGYSRTFIRGGNIVQTFLIVLFPTQCQGRFINDFYTFKKRQKIVLDIFRIGNRYIKFVIEKNKYYKFRQNRLKKIIISFFDSRGTK